MKNVDTPLLTLACTTQMASDAGLSAQIVQPLAAAVLQPFNCSLPVPLHLLPIWALTTISSQISYGTHMNSVRVANHHRIGRGEARA